MTRSLGEIESLAQKATRGAGMDWGIAEDAGKAVRWLSAAGWPGAEALAALLQDTAATPWQARRPRTAQLPWQARGGWLCPLATGVALCDRAGDLAAGAPLRLGRTAWPLLLVPFIARAASLAGASLHVGWAGVTILHAEGTTRAAILDPAALAAASVDAVTVTTGTAADAAARAGRVVPLGARATLAEKTAQRLEAFARRLLAPETPARRHSGAGADAGRHDTDRASRSITSP